MNFKEKPNNQKPREKALKYGVNSLSDYELIAIFLRTGTKEKNVLELSQELIEQLNGLKNFYQINFTSLMKIKGIGKSKALELMSILELAKRIYIHNKELQYEKINGPEDVYNLFKFYYQNLIQEHFFILLLNNQNRIIHQSLLYKGTTNTVTINILDILHLVILYKAKKVICVHNHPSGDSEPSLKDITINQEIKKQFEIFKVILIDHVIIGNENFYSLNLQKKFF